MPSSWANAGKTCSTTAVLAWSTVVTSFRSRTTPSLLTDASASAMRFSPSLAFVKPDMPMRPITMAAPMTIAATAGTRRIGPPLRRAVTLPLQPSAASLSGFTTL